jgi:hypothetical protein
MSTIIRLISLSLPLMAAAVQAESMYKCKQANGSITYTSRGCPEDTVTRENINQFTYHPPSSGSVSAGALPDLEAHQLEQLTREREQREKLRRQESAAKRDTAKVADKKI